MIVSTMNDLPGFQVTEVVGEVFGLTVRSRHVGSQESDRQGDPGRADLLPGERPLTREVE